MRKLSVLLAAALLSASLSGCAKQPEEADSGLFQIESTPAAQPSPTAAPSAPGGDNYTVESHELLFPSDATEDTADYKLSYSFPVFGVEAADKAVNAFLDELYTRVNEERIPLADRAEGEPLPTTAVDFTVLTAELEAGSYSNVIFTEQASYGEGDSEVSVYTIVTGPDGTDYSLAALSRTYAPDETVAQQVLNIASLEPEKYYGDLTLDSILSSLDLYNGFTVAEEGYTVYLPAGSIAEEERGILEFSFARSALYPGFVGDVLTAPEYERLLPQLNAAAAACGPSFSSFFGEPGEFALQFMREYTLNGRATLTTGVSELTAEYQRLYGENRSLSVENAPGVELGGDTVTLSAVTPVYLFNPQDAYLDDEVLTINGEIMAGEPGSSNAAATAAASAQFGRLPGDGEWVLLQFEII